MTSGYIFLTVLCPALAFNIFTKPEDHFENKDEKHFGQTLIPYENGILVPSSNTSARKLHHCKLKEGCAEVNIKGVTKGLKPIVSAAKSQSGNKLLICQQVRKRHSFIEDLNGVCTLMSNLWETGQNLSPAEKVVEEMKQNKSNNNNNNNNNNSNDPEPETNTLDLGPDKEIAFVLDGSGSIGPEDFESAKDFIYNVMKKLWERCVNCKFAIVQYGNIVRTELSLTEKNDAREALEKVKNIQQILSYTITASAINHVLEHVFVPEKGSREDSKKMIIVLTDRRIFLDPMNLTAVLNSPKMQNVVRFAIGVGSVLNDTKGMKELQEIASKPHEKHLLTSDQYSDLDVFISEIESNIIGIKDPGTEIAFVLDGSGSTEPEDFEKAKDFISKVMKKVWESCFSCKFAVVQYGNIITELSLLENNDKKKALEKVKDIQQIKQHTITASAINHVLEHVFVAENGSRKDSKKIIIVLTDGRIFLDPMNLTTVLNSPKMHNILRFATGVGPVLDDPKGMKELQEMASTPHEKHLFQVDSYASLDDLISELDSIITGIEAQIGPYENHRENSNNNDKSSEEYEDSEVWTVPGNIFGENSKKNNNNNNNNEDSEENEDDEDAGTEIAFVLDGSGSIEPEDFEKAKDFISKVMKKVWESCFSCNFSVVQYGSIIRTELSLLENNDVKKALEKVKDIQQIKQHTITASAINHVLEHVFVAENGSREDSKKIIIVLTDGRIFLDPMNLTTVLNSPKMHNILRFAIGVGPVLGDSKGMTELQEIASKPHEDHLFTVGNYTALEDYLSRLEMSLIGMEGTQQGAGFLFTLAEAGFSTHFTHDETLVFGAVGAYDWSGGIILSNQANSTMNFLNTTSTEKGFSYLGYSVTSALGSSDSLYISGAPRYNLTGGVFVFVRSSHKLIQTLPGEQVGSYFGAELCTLDTDRNLKTDYLLVGAPFFHHKGEEGKVYVYKLDNGVFHKKAWELQGIDGHLFARFGSTIASIGDIDGNGYNDVVVGAPLEGQDSSMGNFGSIYIFNSFDGGIRRHFSQRISAADFRQKLMFFGQAVSRMSDQYIAVGSEGAVTVLNVIPVIELTPAIDFTPAIVSLAVQYGKSKKKFLLKLCFSVKRGDIKPEGHLPILYQIDLDVGQEKKRLSFGDSDSMQQTWNLTSEAHCPSAIDTTFMDCDDCFSPIKVRLSFSLPHNSLDLPVRVLDGHNPTVYTAQLPLEVDCADRKVCVPHIVPNLMLSKNMIVLGASDSFNLNIALANKGENSYHTSLLLTYPSILQFNKVSKHTGSVACINKVEGITPQIKCNISHPVLKNGVEANFTIFWQLEKEETETQDAQISSLITCENNNTQVLHNETFNFGIKKALKLHLTGKVDPPVLSFPEDKEAKEALQFTFEIMGENKYNGTIKVNVTLSTRDLDVTIKYTAKKGNCSHSVRNTEIYEILCQVRELQETIKVDAEVFVTSTRDKPEIKAEASLNYDTQLYELVDQRAYEALCQEVPIRKLKVVKSISAIIGGSAGGFILLAIIIIILIKCGFFRRRYQENRKSQSDVQRLSSTGN
ncbi:integrin alpha-E-like isoform X3 [Scleropages formosus]|uniref:integrin alpha-E-like isoform X3 n=1 Tax=Scleropages formosus TaxID=113540 RepID=UPI00087815F4|nr:integrin alpha-E-like isoform X3 [Scleropages formosus]